MRKYKPIKNLHVSAVDVKPRRFDFGLGYGETWDYVLPDVGGWKKQQCIDWLDERGEDRDILSGGSLADLQDKVRESMHDESEDFMPGMNYIYPLPDLSISADEAQSLVWPTNCVVVLIKDDRDEYAETPYLALHGGGMDLSWDICEAYMRLGCLPPFHFCSLPEYAGMKLNAKAKWILAGCRRSCQVFTRWARIRARDLRNLRAKLALNK